jgi:hypothetical protein
MLIYKPRTIVTSTARSAATNLQNMVGETIKINQYSTQNHIKQSSRSGLQGLHCVRDFLSQSVSFAVYIPAFVFLLKFIYINNYTDSQEQILCTVPINLFSVVVTVPIRYPKFEKKYF